MKGASYFLKRVASLAALGSVAVSAVQAQRTLDPVQIYQQVLVMAEASSEAFRKGTRVDERGQPEFMPNTGQGYRTDNSSVVRDRQREQSRQRFEKRLKLDRYGDRYRGSAAYQETDGHPGSRYGSGYESRVSGRLNSVSPDGFSAGPGPAVSGSARQGGDHR